MKVHLHGIASSFNFPGYLAFLRYYVYFHKRKTQRFKREREREKKGRKTRAASVISKDFQSRERYPQEIRLLKEASAHKSPRTSGT